jgi:hypothetical protein
LPGSEKSRANVVGRGGFGCREPSKTAGVQGAALNRRIDLPVSSADGDPTARNLFFVPKQLVAA